MSQCRVCGERVYREREERVIVRGSVIQLLARPELKFPLHFLSVRRDGPTTNLEFAESIVMSCIMNPLCILNAVDCISGDRLPALLWFPFTRFAKFIKKAMSPAISTHIYAQPIIYNRPYSLDLNDLARTVHFSRL